MKENVLAFVAALGCLPILAVVFFLAGALLAEFVLIDAPAPPQWLLALVALFPVVAMLYLRAYRRQVDADHWLERWRRAWYQRKVGYRWPPTFSLEESWLAERARTINEAGLLNRLLNNPALWGWLLLVSLLALAYLFGWLGLMVGRTGLY